MPKERRIYPLTGYSPEIIAVAFAKTSRSPEPFDKIAKELNKNDLPIKPKQIKLSEPIKKAGNYNINIQSGDKIVQIDLEAKAE